MTSVSTSPPPARAPRTPRREAGVIAEWLGSSQPSVPHRPRARVASGEGGSTRSLVRSAARAAPFRVMAIGLAIVALDVILAKLGLDTRHGLPARAGLLGCLLVAAGAAVVFWRLFGEE
jgi:hypothetical protein